MFLSHNSLGLNKTVRGALGRTLLIGALAFGSLPTEAASRSGTSGTAGCFTDACRRKSHHKGSTSKIKYSPKKKSSKGSGKKGSKRSSSKGRSYQCPQGKGPVKHRCPKLEPQIAKVLGGKNVSCYSNLFGVESGCSATVPHDKKKAHNPHDGIGLCAIETSPVVRKNNRRGPKCANIGTVEGQIRCCAHLMTSTKGRYFGTVRCGNTPLCGG